ncbi:response regulator transcription factor [Actinokineospora auranticolor]|uniref:DNA-binding response OmpR family regulator n=1 Tax=Actinokineospora auranticolor TaxID=155976 RepID=A0A2S6GLM2_9PSEU|nr:response regulator transcription factor [Actinokineospora auranticolor]PPK66134.1 DNA-binding response OmpR family regulator [Actinokineospora auranticolor]
MPRETGSVLVVDDDETVRDVVRRYLENAGYAVTVAGDGTEALRRCAAARPDLVVLDVMMPGPDGVEVCRRLRAADGPAVVLLTALGEEEDRVAGLEVGADDYVTKPFSPRELVLRVGSVLRRMRTPPVATPVPDLVDDDLLLRPTARRALLGGVELALTTREFDLLAFLMAHPGTAFTRAELLAEVWGWDFGDQGTVTVHVRRLREKLGSDPSRPARVATVWGHGYRYDRRAP